MACRGSNLDIYFSNRMQLSTLFYDLNSTKEY